MMDLKQWMQHILNQSSPLFVLIFTTSKCYFIIHLLSLPEKEIETYLPIL